MREPSSTARGNHPMGDPRRRHVHESEHQKCRVGEKVAGRRIASSIEGGFLVGESPVPLMMD